MPSKSPAQAHFMAAAAHNPEFAKKAGISQKVAKDFNEHDMTKKRHLVKALRSTGGTTQGTGAGSS